MTVITLSTVGFHEVQPLTSHGRTFTAILIVLGIGSFGYAIGNLAVSIVEGELKEIVKSRRMEKSIQKLKDHIIICGYGTEGRHAGDELSKSKVPFLIIECDAELCSHLRSEGLLVVEGDATHDSVLLDAGVTTAKGLIAAIPQDSENVFVTLTARGFNPHLKIIARASDEASVAKLFRAGANKVITSAQIGGRRMASALLRPKVLNFLDVIMSDSELSLRLEEIDIFPKSPFVGKSIRELHIRSKTGTLVIGFDRSGESLQINPPAETVIESGDVLIVIGNEEQVKQLREMAGHTESRLL